MGKHTQTSKTSEPPPSSSSSFGFKTFLSSHCSHCSHSSLSSLSLLSGKYPDAPKDLCFFWAKHYNLTIKEVPWEEFFQDFQLEFGEQYIGRPEPDWPDGRAVTAEQESLFMMYLDTDMSNSVDFKELAAFVDKDVGLYGSFLSLVGAPDGCNTPLGKWQLGIKEAQVRTISSSSLSLFALN